MSSLTERRQNIFTVDRSQFALAHCISADCAFGEGKTGHYGIAWDFQQHFPGIKQYCINQKPHIGDCIIYASEYGWVFNLVTKQLHWHKPTYETLAMALQTLKAQAVSMNVIGIAMPEIASHLDRLDWQTVRGMIIKEFENTTINLLVCRK
jgi:hypothetical protein